MRQSTMKFDPGLLGDWSNSVTGDNEDSVGRWIRHDCKLVTPLYGGGVRASVVDEKMPIRAAGVRGQLRFWWRVVAGPFSSAEEMFQREMAIWGGIASDKPVASQVAVRVDRVTGLNVQSAFVYKPDPKAPGRYRTMPEAADWVEPYALFPARGELSHDKQVVTAEPHRLALQGLRFRLGVHYGDKLGESQRREVQDTLRWWASFGGVGARTRRGLGAITVSGMSPVTVQEVQANGGDLVLRPAVQQAVDAWKASLARLSEFRQGKSLGRNPPGADPNRPGRSRWPEPDAIRRLTKYASSGHEPTHSAGNCFPRGAFGLPIVFHFKDEKAGDPAQQLLVPAGNDPQQKYDRLASALILRPYLDPNGKGAWHPAVLYLPGWKSRLRDKVRIGNGPDLPIWPADPAAGKRLAQQIFPLATYGGEDPLSAFKIFFTS